MYLILGLGNPDKKYENTRHNIGFKVAEKICEKHCATLLKSGFKSKYAEFRLGFEKVIVAMPQTYMNLSGEAAQEIASFYKIPNENIIVIYDDISLPIGKLRIRAKGSAGGHNGIKSIISHLSTDVFPRIKIGIGAPQNEDYDLADYVLGKFSKDETNLLMQTIDDAVSATECIIKSGIDKSMNMYNKNNK